MNPDSPKLRHQQQTESATEVTIPLHQNESAAREFASVEELIRHDVDQTPVPPELEQRLKESIAHEPKPERSWWRRFFKRE